MITISEAIQSVQSLYSNGVQGKDVDLSSRHIYHSLIVARSTLIRQQSNKSQYINSWIYQTLPAVELIHTNTYEDSNIPITKPILRSKYKLPKVVSDIDDEVIKSVTNIDGTIRYDTGSFETEKYSKGNKYTATKSSVYIRNGYLYVTNETSKKLVSIEAIFEDPIEVFKFPRYGTDCTECDCIDVTTIEFPIDGDLMETLTKMAMEDLVSVFVQMQKDKQNNASDDAGVAKTMIHK